MLIYIEFKSWLHIILCEALFSSSISIVLSGCGLSGGGLTGGCLTGGLSATGGIGFSGRSAGSGGGSIAGSVGQNIR